MGQRMASSAPRMSALRHMRTAGLAPSVRKIFWGGSGVCGAATGGDEGEGRDGLVSWGARTTPRHPNAGRRAPAGCAEAPQARRPPAVWARLDPAPRPSRNPMPLAPAEKPTPGPAEHPRVARLRERRHPLAASPAPSGPPLSRASVNAATPSPPPLPLPHPPSVPQKRQNTNLRVGLDAVARLDERRHPLAASPAPSAPLLSPQKAKTQTSGSALTPSRASMNAATSFRISRLPRESV
jgi:hypothetical protein